MPRNPTSTLFPYTTLFRSPLYSRGHGTVDQPSVQVEVQHGVFELDVRAGLSKPQISHVNHLKKKRSRFPCCRSEEHTSELQSPMYLVCRLLLEKKKYINLK